MLPPSSVLREVGPN